MVAYQKTKIDRAVVDQTGLIGTFDVTLEYTPRSQIHAGTTTSDPAAPPSLITALQEQLGLKLKPQRGPVEVLVIDHVEEPSAKKSKTDRGEWLSRHLFASLDTTRSARR